MSAFKTLDDLPADLTGKTVLVRVDLNVPMDGADEHLLAGKVLRHVVEGLERRHQIKSPFVLSGAQSA